MTILPRTATREQRRIEAVWRAESLL